MQFGNIMYVAELDATVTISPGMLAYVKDEGSTTFGASFKTSPLTTTDLKGKPQSYLSALILILMICRIRICL